MFPDGYFLPFAGAFTIEDWLTKTPDDPVKNRTVEQQASPAGVQILKNETLWSLRPRACRHENDS